MKQPIQQDIFKPKPSRTEAKVDATTRAVRTIAAGESAQRNAKTERLRAARLAAEALEAPAAEKHPSRPARTATQRKSG